MSQQLNSYLRIITGFWLFFLLSDQPLSAQCCSTGSPVGASSYVGVLNMHNIRINTYYRHSYSERYYEGSSPSTDTGSMNYSKNALYSYAGLSLEYGLTHKLTVQFDMGYFFNKKVDILNPLFTDQNGRGLSNGLLLLKYGIYVNPSRLVEITGGLGLKFPFTKQPKLNSFGNAPLTLDARPSTNAFGITATLMVSKEFSDITLRSFILNRYEYNFANINKYQSGQLLITSLFVSKRVVPRLFGIVQLRNEIHGKDYQKGEEEVNTGYHLMVLTPQVSYSILGKWNLSFLYDIPIYKNYKGKQLTPQYSYAVSIAHDFIN
jgi:hypothetical protein